MKRKIVAKAVIEGCKEICKYRKAVLKAVPYKYRTMVNKGFDILWLTKDVAKILA